ncbi:hypothetical protein L873DRAFT_1843163 [Choiromyces venosus 120613-1]|uniref:Uncharacterized protein n=1 Tax=Choiromyces venosus 120613-1 TaxID=1336337 RepID=A0A3N4JPP5_9PEZI|nr:hypothetical protein L873DRAFT_1843163 [Choiromyces venosus 120613-1]
MGNSDVLRRVALIQDNTVYILPSLAFICNLSPPSRNTLSTCLLYSWSSILKSPVMPIGKRKLPYIDTHLFYSSKEEEVSDFELKLSKASKTGKKPGHSLGLSVSNVVKKPGSDCNLPPSPPFFDFLILPSKKQSGVAFRLRLEETIATCEEVSREIGEMSAKLVEIEVGLQTQLGVLKECADSLDVFRKVVS